MKGIIYTLGFLCFLLSCEGKREQIIEEGLDSRKEIQEYKNKEDKLPAVIALENWVELMTGLPAFDSEKDYTNDFFIINAIGTNIESQLFSFDSDITTDQKEYSFKLVDKAKVKYKKVWEDINILDLPYSVNPEFNKKTGTEFFNTVFFASNSSEDWTDVNFSKRENLYITNDFTGMRNKIQPLKWEIKGALARIPVIMADVDFSTNAEKIAVVSEIILARNFSVRVSGEILYYNPLKNEWECDEDKSDILEPDTLVYRGGTQILAFIYSFKPIKGK